MPLTSVLNELGVDPDDVIGDDGLQDKADKAAIEDVGTKDPGAPDPGPDPGQILNTDTDESFDTIQTAVGNATEGDTLLAGAGEYDGDVEIEVEDLSVESAAGPDETTIDGEVSVSANGVTVTGFDVSFIGIVAGTVALSEPATNMAMDADLNGINQESFPDQVSGVTIDDNVVGMLSAIASGKGEVSEVTIENNDADVMFSVGESGGTVSDVTINDNTLSALQVIHQGDETTVADVTVLDNSFEGEAIGEINARVVESASEDFAMDFREVFDENEFDDSGAVATFEDDNTIREIEFEDEGNEGIAGVITTDIAPQFTIEEEFADSIVQPGDTVEIRDGTYEESVTIDVESVRIEAAGGTKPTIEQADEDDNIFTIEESDVTIDSLVIENDDENAIRASPGGSGLEVIEVTVNTESTGISTNGANTTVTNSKIIGHNAQRGVSAFSDSANIKNSTFEGEFSTAVSATTAPQLEINNCHFDGTVTGTDQGIAIEASREEEIVVKGNEFVEYGTVFKEDAGGVTTETDLTFEKNAIDDAAGANGHAVIQFNDEGGTTVESFESNEFDITGLSAPEEVDYVVDPTEELSIEDFTSANSENTYDPQEIFIDRNNEDAITAHNDS